MKKLAIIIVLSVSGASALFAQVQKGAKLIEVGIGGIYFGGSKSTTTYSNTPTIYNSDGNNYSVSLYPEVAWFIADNLAVGASLSLSYYHSESTSTNTGSTTTTNSKYTSPGVYAGPMVRYYFGSSENGRPFAGVNGSFGMYFGNSKSVSSSGSSSETTYKPKGDWSVSATGGYEVFLTPNIGLYATIGVTYGGSKTDYEYVPSSGTGYTYTSDYNSWSVPVNVGLQVHLTPRAK